MTANGERFTFATMPSYLSELPNGPRIGGVNRPGYEISYGSAGFDFPEGERDSRNVLTVDDIPRKRLASFDPTGAAGNGSPRNELRCLTIDDHVRRARSMPPKMETTRCLEALSLQAFGVLQDVDSPRRFRRRALSPEYGPPTRDEAFKSAVRFGDIERVPSRKSFQGCPPPGAWMSPRYAARCTELLDIDSHQGRGSRLVTQPARSPVPDSKSFDMTPLDATSNQTLQSPRAKNLRYYEKTLEAERYAKLIGRPQSQPRTEFSYPQSALKIENLQQRELGWMQNFTVKDRTESCASLELAPCDWSQISSEPNSPMAHSLRNRIFRSLSAISTACSEEGSMSSAGEPPLSKASRSIFANLEDCDLKEAAFGLIREGAEGYDGDDLDNESTRVPLGIRRMVSSLLPNSDKISESMAEELQAAIGVSMAKLVKPKDVRHRAQAAMRRRPSPFSRRQMPNCTSTSVPTSPKLKKGTSALSALPVAIAG